MIDVVLHSTDFSPESDQAFEYACSIARDQFASMVVVHVLSPFCGVGNDAASEIDLQMECAPAVQTCRERFEKLKAKAGEVPISFRMVVGYPVAMILKVAREEAADLIVLAEHHRSHHVAQRQMNVAEAVMRQSHCPVFNLRRASHTPSLSASHGEHPVHPN